ncbi:LOW QUALITY PROTEIN: WRKY DNA-binding transcription factor 70-like [Abrus precatorius]|uniref:LOW QUALITY PROTEIN: WRKY DNA-binding transcription factor 70-like n=1 Tax=Abrus precatorius TaxID=3816 RepID=A0A8B8K5E9_ABRPR|nr:LOW QUALITY PROTEIN: WRKY DNA-binding transcription factor 70-like [Abrus precatorius]
MSIFFPQSASAKRKRVIRELVQGQKDATQLKFLLQQLIGPDGSVSAMELATNVLRSFDETLSVLTSSEVSAGSADDEVAQNLVDSGEAEVAASSIDPMSEDSSESRKRSLPVAKDRRGSYKRRKTEQTRTIVSQTTDDNYAWRKYGQKEILNSQFPRSYFRCTRKYDQGCQATKQVQRTQENPDMYHITYIGFHTCKDTLKGPQMVAYSDTWDSFLVNSHPDSNVPNEEDSPIISKSPNIKRENPNDDTLSDLTDANLWSDLKDIEISNPSVHLIMQTGSQCLHMDFGFSTDFHFDGGHLL